MSKITHRKVERLRISFDQVNLENIALGRSSIRINHNAYRGYGAIAHDLYRIQSSCSLIRVVVRATFNQNIAITKTGFSVIGRSEEHTSELQSLMRISYAVFCLK